MMSSKNELQSAKSFFYKALSHGYNVDKENNQALRRSQTREYYIQEFPEHSVLDHSQIDQRLRTLGANFFQIIGIEQPKTAKKYDAVIANYLGEYDARDIDK